MNRNDIYLYMTIGGHTESKQLLLRAAADWCRRVGITASDFKITRTETGKPYFKHIPQLHFSISHSGGWWLCAMGQQILGLDVQQEKVLDAIKLSSRFFHQEESDYLKAHPEDFFRVWTGKESYAKFTGTGIAGTFRSFSVVENSQLKEKLNKITLRHLPFKTGYVLCLCCQELGELHWIEEF